MDMRKVLDVACGSVNHLLGDWGPVDGEGIDPVAVMEMDLDRASDLAVSMFAEGDAVEGLRKEAQDLFILAARILAVATILDGGEEEPRMDTDGHGFLAYGFESKAKLMAEAFGVDVEETDATGEPGTRNAEHGTPNQEPGT
jgi:hypothetical protein